MKTEEKLKIAQKTLIYAAIAAIIYYVTIVKNYIFPIYLENGYIEIVTSEFFQPLIVVTVLLFAQDIIDILFTGEYVPYLNNSLIYMVIAIPAWMVSKLYPQIEIVTIIAYSTMLSITGNLMINILRLYSSKKDNYALLVGVKFFSIILNGFIIWFTLKNFLTIDITTALYDTIEGLSSLILPSSILTAFFSLAVFGESSDNPYVSTFSKRININSLENFIRIFSLLSYLFYVRPEVDQFLADNSQYLPYVEWGVITLIAVLLFRDLRNYVAKDLTREDVMGTWQKHLQEIEVESDYRIDILSKSVDNFLNNGEKEVLLVYLINLLSNTTASRFHAPNALRDLIYYKPKDPELITFRWNREKAIQEDLSRRKEILKELLPLVEELSYNQGTIGTEDEITIRGDTI